MNENTPLQPEEAQEEERYSRKKIAAAVGGALLLGVATYGGIYAKEANDSLGKIPRANLLPSQTQSGTPEPTGSGVTISGPSTPTTTLNSINKQLQNSAKGAATQPNTATPFNTVKNGNGVTVQSTPGMTTGNITGQSNTGVTTQGDGSTTAANSPALLKPLPDINHLPKGVDKTKEVTLRKKGLTSIMPATKAKASEVEKHSVYSTNPNSVAGVSTVVNPITTAKTPNGVDVYALIGTDSRNPATTRGRSDSLMLAYVNKAHDKVYLVSFPRDLYVKIPGYAKQKINAAYSYGGAPLTVQTLQSFTGVQVDHAALVNFNSFVNMVDSVGGVTVYNPYPGCDNQQHLCWKKGNLHLSSWDALHYVRWRHGLPNGDITRSQNQQRVVKAIMEKTMTASNLANPSKMSGIISAAGKNMVLDSGLTNKVILEKALGMRLSSGADIRTITAPIAGYYMDPIYGSVDLVNAARMQELRNALARDDLDSYWNKYKDAPVAGAATMY